jgi:uncharacterized membrane protein
MNQDELNDLEWGRPDNWTSLGLYRCARDPRILVPKRNPVLGWTVNIAHRGGRVWLAVLLALGILITLAVPFAVWWYH